MSAFRSRTAHRASLPSSASSATPSARISSVIWRPVFIGAVARPQAATAPQFGKKRKFPSARKILLALLLSHSALAGDPGSGRRCNPGAATCTACRDCTRCGACAKRGLSCSVMRDQSGDQQRARDAKRQRLQAQ